MSKPWNRLPSAKWLRALDGLIVLAEQIAKQHELELIIERSGGSEARYLHIRQGDTWFGIRIAAHFPVYACSRDYFQVFLDDPPSDQTIDYSKRQLTKLVLECRQAVADPSDVTYVLAQYEAEKPSLRQVADLRHRLNQRAKWVYDIQSQSAH